jgi:hypothetical protein
MIEIDNSDGLDETMRGLVLAVLDINPNVGAVYSIGGNTAHRRTPTPRCTWTALALHRTRSRTDPAHLSSCPAFS